MSGGKEDRCGDLWPQPAALRTKRVSVLSQPNSGVEDPTRAGLEARAGGGAQRHGDPPGPQPGALARALPAVRPCPGGVRGSGVASLVFLEGRGCSRLGRPNLGSAPNRGGASRSSGMASLAFPGAALRVLAAPGPGAPWLPDLGPVHCRLKDPAGASRAGSRARGTPGPFT